MIIFIKIIDISDISLAYNIYLFIRFLYIINFGGCNYPTSTRSAPETLKIIGLSLQRHPTNNRP